MGIGRNVEALQKLKSERHIVDYILADLSSADLIDGRTPCNHVVVSAANILGGLTAVVNGAGVIQAGAAGDVTVENYDFNMNTNTRASFEIMTHAIPYLKEAAKEALSKKEEGEVSETEVSPSIVNISSVNGKQSFPGCISYCMSKAAVDMMTKCASVDLAKYGVRINSVNLGMVETNFQKVCDFDVPIIKSSHNQQAALQTHNYFNREEAFQMNNMRPSLNDVLTLHIH